MPPVKRYYPEQMLRAIEAVKKGSNLLTAARKFGVPRITLRNKITGKSPVVCGMGPPSIVTKEQELEFVKWLHEMSGKNCPVGKEHILDSVQQFVIRNNIDNPFTNNRPGKNWFYAFLKRHPGVSEKISQNFFKSRGDITEEKLKAWFSDIHDYLQHNNLLDILKDPRRMFTSDEAVFYLNPKNNRVLVKRSASNIYSVIGNKKGNPRVFLTANAMGDVLPPTVMFADQGSSFGVANIPEGWGVGTTKTGWMCGFTLYDYMTNIFHPWLVENNITLPVIYFLDGDATHLTYHLSEFCSKNQIELLALYPNAARIQKTMDVALFRPLRAFWKKECTVWKRNNYNHPLQKENFGPIMEKALKAVTPACIRNGFKVGGLFPFGNNDIDFNELKSTKIENIEPDRNDINFFRTLEKEIAANFTETKIDLFNIYYGKTDKSENDIPKEDETLYTIWSKYKDKCKDVADNSTENEDSSPDSSPEQKFSPDNINTHIHLASRNLESDLEVVDSDDSERSYLSLSDESSEETPTKRLPLKAAKRLLFHRKKKVSPAKITRVRIKEEKDTTTKTVRTIRELRELNKKQIITVRDRKQQQNIQCGSNNKRKIEPEKKTTVVKRPKRIYKRGRRVTSSEDTTESEINMTDYGSDDDSGGNEMCIHIKEETNEGSDTHDVEDTEGRELSDLDIVKKETEDDSVVIYVTNDDVNILYY